MEFIITFLLIIFLAAWVAGKIFPFLLKRFLKKRFGIDTTAFNGGNGSKETKSYSNYKDADSAHGREKTEEERRVGQVTEIVVTEEHEKIIDSDLGEYVEYEEISYNEKK